MRRSPMAALALIVLLSPVAQASGAGAGPAEIVRLKMPVEDVRAPVDLYSPATNGGALVTQQDGAIRFFYRVTKAGEPAVGHEGSGSILHEDRSDDGGRTWKLFLEVMNTGPGSGHDVAHVNPYNGEIYLFYSRGGRTYLKRSAEQGKAWRPDVEVPFRCVWDSIGFTWLRQVEATGEHRLVVVTTLWLGEGRDRKAAGAASYYSDDDGKSWTGPSNLVTTKEYPGRWINPSASGQVVELADGRLWMLTRSSQDHLWQAYSGDRGKSWKHIGPSRFIGVFSNVRLERISGDRLLMVWLNNMPFSGITTAGSFHNTARDVLHAAISLDDGATWRGFREVLLDRNRHALDFASPEPYDAGVHHPKFTVTRGGKVVVFTGQDDDMVTWGSPHRRAVIFDQQWLLETERSNDFLNGIDDLCTPLLSKLRWRPSNYYARVPGARITGHPALPFRNVLQVGRPAVAWVLNEQAGATWNFPTGTRGRLETRVLLRNGFQGGAISLTDTYYNPSDNAGEAKAMFVLALAAGGAAGDTTLVPERWYDIAIEWNGTAEEGSNGAALYVDGVLQKQPLPLRNPSVNGVNYVRFRSTAPAEDLAGFLVDHVRARVIW